VSSSHTQCRRIQDGDARALKAYQEKSLYKKVFFVHTTFGLGNETETKTSRAPEPARLVYGGGGDVCVIDNRAIRDVAYRTPGQVSRHHR